MVTAPGAKTIPFRWTSRTVPLSPAAVIAEDPTVATELLRRVLDYPETTLSGLAGIVTSAGLVALLALRPDSLPLPWVDGVRYLGQDPDAGASLLIPTEVEPTVPALLLYRALRLRYPDAKEPLAVWPSRTQHGAENVGALKILSLCEARALDRTVITRAYQRLLQAREGKALP